jgi:hypothetical protein
MLKLYNTTNRLLQVVNCSSSGKEGFPNVSRPYYVRRRTPAEPLNSLGLAVDSCKQNVESQGDNSASPEMSEEKFVRRISKFIWVGLGPADIEIVVK